MPIEFGKDPNKAIVYDDGSIGVDFVNYGSIEIAQAAAYDIERQGRPLQADNIRKAIQYVKKNPKAFLEEFELEIPEESNEDELSDLLNDIGAL